MPRLLLTGAGCGALLVCSLAGQTLTPGPQGPPSQDPKLNNNRSRYFDVAYTFGYRWLDVDGSQDRFDTDYNLDEGFRLRNLTIDGHFENTVRFPSRIRLESNNLADPFERHRFEIEKPGLYEGAATFTRNRYKYRATGDFHRVDRKEQIATYDLSVPIGSATVFASFSRADLDGFWLTSRIGNRNLTPLTAVNGVQSPRTISEDRGEFGITLASSSTTLTAVGEYFNQSEDNRWAYSQPATGNPAFLESEDLRSGASLEGPGARLNLSHADGPFEATVESRWIDRRRRIVGTGSGTGFDTAAFNLATNSLSRGSARTILVDGLLSYELRDDLTLTSDFRYLDHQEELRIDQTDLFTYPTLSSQVAVNTNRDQRTTSRIREATAGLDWQPHKSLILSGGWGWSQQKLAVPDLEPGDNDFRRGTIVESGFTAGAQWRPDARWTVKARYRDFGQGGVQLHPIMDNHTRGVRSSLGYRKEALWWEAGVNHFRSQNYVADSRTARTAYTLSGGYAPSEEFSWHGSYALSDINSRTRTNFYFDPSPTPVSTLVGFRGESHSLNSGLEWRLNQAFHASLFGSYTTVSGDFDLDLYHVGVDLAMLLPQGKFGVRVESMDYSEQTNPDDYDAWMVFVYVSGEIKAARQ